MTNITPISENKPYKDPLKKLSILSYSNEAGAAIAEIAPRFGSVLWIPTFMYLGADIYDKYKNDQDNYNPSTKRAFKQTVYQGITNLLALPTVIYGGQCLVSPLGRIDKSGISGNAKDAIYKHIKDVIEEAHGDTLDNLENFQKFVISTLQNKIEARSNEKNTINFLKKIYNKIFTQRYTLLRGNKDKIIEFARLNTQKAFEIFTKLKNNDTKNIPKLVNKKYHEALPAMREMYMDDYSYHAAKTALKELQNAMIFKNKILKTAGGITALFLLANPVNKFVDKYVMKKFVNPQIDNFTPNIIYNSKIKQILDGINNSQENNTAIN